MPTHQGKTQTDILIGDTGESAAMAATLDWELTSGTSAELGVEERSGALDVDTACAVTVRDAAGSVVATLFAQLRAFAEPKGATELVRTRTDRYAPLPGSATAGWPTAPETLAIRDWSAEAGSLGALQAAFEVATAAAAGVQVSQVVVAQDPTTLEVQLTFVSGRTVLAEARVTCTASATGTATPVVDDQFQP